MLNLYWMGVNKKFTTFQNLQHDNNVGQQSK